MSMSHAWYRRAVGVAAAATPVMRLAWAGGKGLP